VEKVVALKPSSKVLPFFCNFMNYVFFYIIAPVRAPACDDVCHANQQPDQGGVSLFGLLLLGAALLGLVSLQHSDSLLHLGLEGLVVLQHVQQLRVVDLEQHAGDLTREIGVHTLDEREKALAKHLFLLVVGSGSQHGSGQRLLALDEHSLLHLSTKITDGSKQF
jgi:hypothetical protein